MSSEIIMSIIGTIGAAIGGIITYYTTKKTVDGSDSSKDSIFIDNANKILESYKITIEDLKKQIKELNERLDLQEKQILELRSSKLKNHTEIISLNHKIDILTLQNNQLVTENTQLKENYKRVCTHCDTLDTHIKNNTKKINKITKDGNTSI